MTSVAAEPVALSDDAIREAWMVWPERITGADRAVAFVRFVLNRAPTTVQPATDPEPVAWHDGRGRVYYEEAEESDRGLTLRPLYDRPVQPATLSGEQLAAGARSLIDGCADRPGVSWAEEARLCYAAILAATAQPVDGSET